MSPKVYGGRYEVQKKVGSGGMATVYISLDRKLKREVAIKVLHDHLSVTSTFKARFQSEAQVLASIEHPNIVKVFDYSGFSGPDMWIVMELLRGETLNRFTQKFPKQQVQPEKALEILYQLARAVHHIHGKGVIHRDIKLENVMLLKKSKVVLTDFGIARNQLVRGVTRCGEIMGSPHYMAPEQIKGTEIDHRADIFSLGVLFYRLLTGEFPFVGNSPHVICQRIMNGNYLPPNMLVPDIAPATLRTVIRCLASKPSQRYSNMREMFLDIRESLICERRKPEMRYAS